MVTFGIIVISKYKYSTGRELFLQTFTSHKSNSVKAQIAERHSYIGDEVDKKPEYTEDSMNAAGV